LLLFIATQRNAIEQKEFSLLKRAVITGFISTAAFATKKLLTSKKFHSPRFSSALKFVSAGLPTTYILSHLGYTDAPTEYLNNIFKFTHGLYLDKVFFLPSPSQILAEKIEKIDLEETNAELLSEALFYLSEKKQRETILKINNKNKINQIAIARPDLAYELISNLASEDQKIKKTCLVLDEKTVKTVVKLILKKQYPLSKIFSQKKYSVDINLMNLHLLWPKIKNILSLPIFDSDLKKINFLKEMDLFNNIYPVLKYFLKDYYTDVTSNISLLFKDNNDNNDKAICSSIIYELEKNNRLFEVKKLLEDEGIQSKTKTNMICNISYFFEDDNITDENKTKLKKILADINMIEFWKTLDKKSDKKFDMFQTITTHFTSYNNSFEEKKAIEIKNKKEETIKSIFEYEIQNLTESSYDPAIISRDLSSHKKELRKREFIGFSF
jgi:hypothetical protein